MVLNTKRAVRQDTFKKKFTHWTFRRSHFVVSKEEIPEGSVLGDMRSITHMY